VAELQEAGLRADLDARNEKIGYRVREAQMEKIPYMLVVGEKEAAAKAVAVRTRAGGDRGVKPLSEFMSLVAQEAKIRSLTSLVDGKAENSVACVAEK
jgi:threonyl-tRNA synthetase